CFLLPTSSPSEHNGTLDYTPSSEEINPTKFPELNSAVELSPPHDILYKLPDTVFDDEKQHEK
ncbi:RBP1 protein, partial [Pteruthius melanotis]|nr:RBP1 protein [Pteruthius melanotis]